MKRLFAGLAAACLIAACASPHHTVTSPHTTTVPPCQTMNCVLGTVHGPIPRYTLVPGERYGIDFAWRSVGASAAKSLGVTFAASYLSTDTSKNWTRALVNAYHAAGISTVAVWETTAARAEDGFAAGVADARTANGQAATLGNHKRTIFFAVDCDCAGASILPYFKGVFSVLGSRAGAYGGYSQVGFLASQHVVGPVNWQTYAWSRGLWLSASIAPLEQYLNGTTFDNDRALSGNFGQWPYSTSKPPKPKPAKCWGKHSHPRWKACRPIRARYSKDVSNGKHWWKLAREIRKAHS